MVWLFYDQAKAVSKVLEQKEKVIFASDFQAESITGKDSL